MNAYLSIWIRWGESGVAIFQPSWCTDSLFTSWTWSQQEGSQAGPKTFFHPPLSGGRAGTQWHVWFRRAIAAAASWNGRTDDFIQYLTSWDGLCESQDRTGSEMKLKKWKKQRIPLIFYSWDLLKSQTLHFSSLFHARGFVTALSSGSAACVYSTLNYQRLSRQAFNWLL